MKKMRKTRRMKVVRARARARVEKRENLVNL